MTTDVLICPGCRARVFGSWVACKFCGVSLQPDRIDATVDPDLLGAPAGPEAGGHGPASVGHVPPDAAFDEPAAERWDAGWSPWAAGGAADPAVTGAIGPAAESGGAPWWSSGPEADEPAAPGGWASSGNPPSSGGWDAPVGEAGGSSLVPLEGAEPTWAPGPAPAPSAGGGVEAFGSPVYDAPAPGEGTVSTRDADEGPAGLDPVSWYPEPGAPTTPDDAPAGLDPVSWYPEPGTATGAPASSFGSPPPGDPPGSGFADSGFTGAGFAGSGMPGSGFPAADPTAPVQGMPGGGSSGFPPPPDFTPPPVDPVGGTGFDPGGLYDEPDQPVAPRGFSTGLEKTRAGEVAVNWQPAAADAWDAPVDPVGKPKRQAALSREARLLLAAIVFVLVVLAAGIGIRERDAGHPSQWASNVQQMADWVADARELPFAHPVTVATLPADEYDAAVAAAERPENEGIRDDLAAQVAMWRALGAVQGKPTETLHTVAVQRPELGAFYDLDQDRLVVRRGADPGTLRIGLAGALSVAMDDQRADLSSLTATGIGENPRFDMVFGTAALLRADYARAAGGDAVPTGAGTDDAPRTDAATAFLGTRAELQSRLGEPFVQLVRDVQGIEAADALAAAAPVASQQVLAPMAYFDGRGPLAVEAPVVPDGADRLDEGSLGAQTWYLLLAAHVDDPGRVTDLLEFADRWAGDAFVAYRKANRQVCVTDVIRGSADSQTVQLAAALESWAAGLPEGQVEVTRNGTATVTVSACDPGAEADQQLRPTLDTAVDAAVTRSQLAAHYHLEGTKIPNGVNGPVFPPEVAWCLGSQAVALAQPDQLADLAARREPTYRDLTMAAAGRCNTSMADQLFVERDD